MRLFSNTIHRNILESLLKKNLPNLKGPILDIGSKNRRYDYLLAERPTAIDITSNEKNDVIFGDMHSLPFNDFSFNSVLAVETLEYSIDPQQAIAEIFRVLNTGGALIMSVPFLFPSHGDSLRFTNKYLKDVLLVNFSEATILSIGNSTTILLDIIRNNYFSIKNPILKYVLFPFFTLCMLPVVFKRSAYHSVDRYASGYFIIARK